jgi:cytochrome c-type biogenesis protein CcmH/NrfG
VTLLEKYAEDCTLFVELGFIAATQMDGDSALTLFRAATALNPNNLLPKIGVGYVHLLKLEIKQACKIFEEALKQDPSNEMALALLGLSTVFTVKEAGRGEKMLQDVLAKTTEPTVKTMATTALDFVDKHIKKEPTPAQGDLLKNNALPRTNNAQPC